MLLLINLLSMVFLVNWLLGHGCASATDVTKVVGAHRFEKVVSHHPDDDDSGQGSSSSSSSDIDARRHSRRDLAAIADRSRCYFINNNVEDGIICPDLCGPGYDWMVLNDLVTDTFGDTNLISICSWYCSEPLDCSLASFLQDEIAVTDPSLICNECDEGIMAGGGLRNCFLNQAGTWTCYYREVPLPWVPLPPPSFFTSYTSYIVFACNVLPEIEPLLIIVIVTSR